MNEPASKQKTIESRQQKALVGLAVLVFLFVVIRTAWLSDDAYITFRVVENFVHGFGPVYNLGERVQAYTHPLWFFLISGVYAVVTQCFWQVFSGCPPALDGDYCFDRMFGRRGVDICPAHRPHLVGGHCRRCGSDIFAGFH